MTGSKRGDVVRVPFPYTDRPIRERRPALVISDGGIGPDHAILWVVMITSAENRRWPHDVPFGADFGSAGLPAPSVARPAKIATIAIGEASLLGSASAAVMEQVDRALRTILGTPSASNA